MVVIFVVRLRLHSIKLILTLKYKSFDRRKQNNRNVQKPYESSFFSFFGAFGEYPGEVGEYDGDVGEYCGDVGE